MSRLLSELRESRPLVHCMTNIVVANFQANGLLALGASPVMAAAPEEAEEMAAAASCTVLNIGTLHREALEAMELAGKSANRAGNPVILDPVGAGATRFRRDAVSRLLGALDVALIRCNAGELAAIAGVDWRASGVDAGEGTMDTEEVAAQVARQHGCLVAVTGETDVLTDGERTVRIGGGHPAMSRITGAGCLLSAVCGAFLTAGKDDPFRSVAAALAFYKAAGEGAAETSSVPGSFLPAFIDLLALLEDGDFELPESAKEVRA
ncbi:Hydroxyethylthiazole kinase [Bhargavaea cecembensis DSE10]|uniref:Hydroxyethylthiazole kinase n=1 Tax=Bhargavaea cecembensis DSE10 TaxID=1235279 RepID=M7NCT1_9BACL|nr:hydroxyethylthiazole kinase [Bhargavaea cecembensis]EMR06378.1 Hydroxyethylthiazole kinase [Bhargavaea cecembensis DSE10]